MNICTALLRWQGLTMKLVAFREALPGVNVSLLVSRWPYLVLEFDAESLQERLRIMRCGARDDAILLMPPPLAYCLALDARNLPK